MTSVAIDKGEARVRLDTFDQEAYELFLRCKQLPEKRIDFDHADDSYTVVTHERFAGLLDPSLTTAATERQPLAEHLFDYQRWIVERALDARRFACWADTGLGKTAIYLEWALQLADEGALILEPNRDVVRQTVEMAEEFYADPPIEVLNSREDLERWCGSKGIGIATYHLLAREELPALRRCGAIALDESSILKTGGGSIKWNLIHSAKGVPYKLSNTATPAPNDTMEYASQASFLEVLRHEGEILWTFFSRQGKSGKREIKPHAREAFYRFMASWSVYLRDPAAYGFEPILDSLPDPVYHEHRIGITEAQRDAMAEIMLDTGRGLFDTNLGVRERSKLAQIARGFVYEGQGKDRRARTIDARKPREVARLALEEDHYGRPTLIWTNFDEESEILAAEIGSKASVLSGATPDRVRAEIIDAFRHGGIDILITKPALLGYGLNFQRCKAMVFSGLDDSFERRYQAVRRAYRLGQTDPVHVHLPHVPELEGHLLENVDEKERRFEADVAQMEANYVEAING